MIEIEYNWITTYTGKRFHYLKPTFDEIDIRDIAHHLSLLCRFTGACRCLYTVAEHSVRMVELLPEELKLAGLLHDAPEAYLNDIARPVKHSHKLDETERIISSAIDKKYGIDSGNPLIRRADDILLATEARDLMPNMNGWRELPPPMEKRIIPANPSQIEKIFLAYFKLYKTGGRFYGKEKKNPVGSVEDF